MISGSVVAAILLASLTGCAGRSARPTTVSGEPVPLEGMAIVARNTEDGLQTTAVNPGDLFRTAFEHAEADRCDEALPLYRRLIETFPDSPRYPSALYNAGLCERRAGNLPESAAWYQRLLDELPESPDVLHARFQLMDLWVELERHEPLLQQADATLLSSALSVDERIEAMARRAQALLGLERYEDAATQAIAVRAYARRHEEDVRFDYFRAAANFVLAETLRREFEAVVIPEGTAADQHAVLQQSAGLILRAQGEYFDTMRFADAEWTAVSGYRIGQMYDHFWDSIVSAPIPPSPAGISAGDRAEYEAQYRVELRRLVQPLMRHAIRYWELTLQMIERTGVESPWQTQIRDDLERARARLIPEDAASSSPTSPAPSDAS